MRENTFIGYLFGCSHGCPPEVIPPRRERIKNRNYKKIECPICGNKTVFKVFRCIECGRFFKKHPCGVVYRCPPCREETINAVARAAYKNRNAEQKKRKKPIDQTRRGECKWGTYCIDQQLKTGIEFNCHECLKFEPLTLDVLDYMSAGVDVLEQGSNMAAI